jgi:hypothetical protein
MEDEEYSHPLWRHLTTAVPSDIGDPLLNTWILAWDGHALLTDPAHLFDANIFFPLKDTLAYSEHLLGTALPMVPILLISGEPVLAYNVAFLTSFMLSGFGLYLLALRYTGNRLAAFLAGLAFAFAPYHLSLMGHLSLLTVQWLPLALLYLDAFLQPALTPPFSHTTARNQVFPKNLVSNPLSRRSLALFVFFFICQAGTSWHLAVFAAFIVALYVLGNWLTRRAAFSWPVLAGLGATALVVALVMAPLIPPYLKVLPELHKTRPWDTIVAFAATPTDYLAAYPANLFFGQLTAPFRTRTGFVEEHTLFPGLLASVLTALSLPPPRPSPKVGGGSKKGAGPSTLRRGSGQAWLRTGPSTRLRTGGARSVVGIFWVILVLSVSLTFGPFLRLEGWGIAIPMPYHLLAGLTSALSLMRVPPRWMVVGLFAMSLLLGFGLTSLFAWAQRKGWSTQRVYGLALLLGLGLLAEGYAAPIPLAQVGSTAQLPEVYCRRSIAGWPAIRTITPSWRYPSTVHLSQNTRRPGGSTPAPSTGSSWSTATAVSPPAGSQSWPRGWLAFPIRGP